MPALILARDQGQGELLKRSAQPPSRGDSESEAASLLEYCLVGKLDSDRRLFMSVRQLLYRPLLYTYYTRDGSAATPLTGWVP